MIKKIKIYLFTLKEMLLKDENCLALLLLTIYIEFTLYKNGVLLEKEALMFHLPLILVLVVFPLIHIYIDKIALVMDKLYSFMDKIFYK